MQKHIEPAVSPNMLSIGLTSPTIALSWSTNPANVGGYHVYRSPNPYFTLGDSGVTLVATTQQDNYADMGANLSISNFYGIGGIDKCGRVSGVEENAGIFPFPITPGNQ